MTSHGFPIRRSSSVLLVVAMAALTGCAASATSPASDGSVAATPTASPTATPSPPPVALGSQVFIDGTGLSFASDDGEIVDSVAFTADPVEARDRVTEWLASTPTTTSTVSTHYCAVTTDPIITDVWGDGLSMTHLSFGEEAGYRFSVALSVPSVGEVEVGTPQGFGVGDSTVELIAAIPGVDADMDSGVTRVYYDQPDAGWTAYAWGWEGGPIEQIRAPYSLVETC
jgi:hypothetical protein